MIPDDPTPLDDRLLDSLLAADAALAQGSTVETQDPEVMADVDCLVLLEQLWPRAPRACGEADDGSFAAEPPRRLGRFEVIRALGQGGFGIVYLARDPVLGREVALKVPRPEALITPEVRRRYLREARAAAGLDHPNIVPVHEAGELGPICYIASTYCPGPTLSAWLKARAEPVPARLAARLMLPLADAVQHAHDREVLHRDIKPSNIILTGCQCPWTRAISLSERSTQDVHACPCTASPVVVSRVLPRCGSCLLQEALVPRLTDFGLARIVEEVGDESRTGVPIGSPPYMAPEQAAGRIHETGPRTDVYALGATLYEVLTGRPPFRGETPAETIRLVLEAEPLAPRVLRPGLPRDLETICLKCLEKDSQRRYPAAAALRDDLQRFLEGKPIAARPVSIWQRAARQVRRRPAHAAAAALALLLPLVLLGAFLYHDALRESYTRLLEREVTRADANARLARRHLQAFQLQRAKQQFHAGQVERAQEILREIVHPGQPSGGVRHQFAWEYLWNRSRRSLSVLSSRDEQVTCMALSADGRTLITGDEDGTIRLRDPRSGDLRASLRGHRFRVYHLTASPDGDTLGSAAWSDARAAGDEVLVWDLKQLRPRFRLDGPGDESISILRFDERGGRLWCSGELEAGRPTLCLWDLRGDPSPPSLRWRGRAVPGMPITSDGKAVAIQGEGNRIEVRDPSSDRALGATGRLKGSDLKAALSPSGRLLAYHVRDTRTLRVCDVAAGKDRFRFDDIHGILWDLEFSPDERFLLSTNDMGELLVRDLSAGRVRSIAPEAPEQAVHYAQFSSDSRRLASTYNGDASGAHPIRIVDLDGFSVVATYPGEVHRIGDLMFTPDGRSLLVRTSEAVVRWDLEPIAEPAQPSGHTDEAWAVAFSPDGAVLASGSDDTDEPATIKLWDMSAARLIRGWSGGAGTVSALAFDRSGRVLASGHLERADNVRLWDPATGKPLGILPGHTDRVRALAFSPDGKLLATTGSDRSVRVWDVESRNCVRVLTGHGDTVASLAFSPDGRQIASAGCDRTIHLWDMAAGSVSRLPWVEKFSSLAFAPDGHSLIAADEDGRITVWDVKRRSRVQTIETEDEELRCLSLSPNGETVAAAGKGREVRLWDLVTCQELLTLEGHASRVNGVVFSPDGSTLASCSHDGAVRLWRSKP